MSDNNAIFDMFLGHVRSMRMRTARHYVYGLYAEGDGFPFYIGCSVDCERRLREHVSFQVKATADWLRAKLALGAPEIKAVVLDEGSRHDMLRQECYWIKKHKPVCNIKQWEKWHYCREPEPIDMSARVILQAGSPL